jgi:hypothetical protein
MKKHFYKKKIKVPLFVGNFNIVFTNDYSKTDKIFDDLGEFYTCFSYSQEYEFNPYLFFNFWHKSKITHGVIAHEALHAADHFLEIIGYRTDVDNNETKCYLIQFIVDEIYKFAEKNKIKIHTS